MRWRVATLTLALAGLSACASFDDSAAGGVDSFQDDDIPMGGCDTETSTGGDCHAGTAGGQAGVGAPCDFSNQCSGTAVCAAPFNEGDIGELVCQAMCIDNDDHASWCSDDAACCDENATCSPRGLCLPGVADDTAGDASSSGGSSGSSGGSDSTDGTTDASSSSGGSGGSESSSGSESSTG